VVDGAKATLVELLNLQSAPDLIASGVDFKKIHDLLLSSPNGVPKAAFVGATGSPKRVCAHLQELHPFLYHYPSKEYRYAGKEYENAAKEL
jgi:hypothetical protein